MRAVCKRASAGVALIEICVVLAVVSLAGVFAMEHLVQQERQQIRQHQEAEAMALVHELHQMLHIRCAQKASFPLRGDCSDRLPRGEWRLTVLSGETWPGYVTIQIVWGQEHEMDWTGNVPL